MLPGSDRGQAANMKQQELLRDAERRRRAGAARRAQRRDLATRRTIRLHGRLLTYAAR